MHGQTYILNTEAERLNKNDHKAGKTIIKSLD